MKNNKSINTNLIEKLDDDSLECIVGGIVSRSFQYNFPIIVVITGLVELFLVTGAISLSSNSSWLRRKVKKAKEKTAQVERMEKFADLYADVSIGISSFAGASFIALGIIGGIEGVKHG